MKQKDYLLKVFDMLGKDFPLFRALKTMIVWWDLDENGINWLVEVFNISMTKTQNKDELDKLKQAILMLQNIPKN